jgi:hypothetical protein
MNGKGSKQRTTDYNTYWSNYDLVFNKKVIRAVQVANKVLDDINTLSKAVKGKTKD